MRLYFQDRIIRLLIMDEDVTDGVLFTAEEKFWMDRMRQMAADSIKSVEEATMKRRKKPRIGIRQSVMLSVRRLLQSHHFIYTNLP